jgi:hypothetical protein
MNGGTENVRQGKLFQKHRADKFLLGHFIENKRDAESPKTGSVQAAERHPAAGA